MNFFKKILNGMFFLLLITIIFVGCVNVDETDMVTVTFSSLGSSLVTAESVEVGTLVPMPDEPIRTNYVFEGWYTDYSFTNFWNFTNDFVYEDTIIYAKWTAGFKVSYDSQSASTLASPTYAAVLNGNTVISLPIDPIREGYIFGGWFTAPDGVGTEFDTSIVVTGNLTVYAKWSIIQYVITYDDQNATTPVSPGIHDVNYSNTISVLPTEPIKTDFAFGGWTNSNGSYFDNNTVVTNNMTVYAQWLPIYTVTYDGSGNDSGTVPVDDLDYTNGQEVTVVSNTGNLVKLQDVISLRLLGWTNSSGVLYTNGSKFAMGSENVSLYAKWSSVLRCIGPAGGLVYYDRGDYYGTPSWRYLEAAPFDQTPSVWGDTTFDLQINETSIGTGQENTLIIVEEDHLLNKAADICTNLSITSSSSTFTNWFLPSLGELAIMYTNLQSGVDQHGVIYIPVGNFNNEFYWSSSEFIMSSAYVKPFSPGLKQVSDKSDYYGVRAVRYF